jgi:hypothetical protein
VDGCRQWERLPEVIYNGGVEWRLHKRWHDENAPLTSTAHYLVQPRAVLKNTRGDAVRFAGLNPTPQVSDYQFFDPYGKSVGKGSGLPQDGIAMSTGPPAAGRAGVFRLGMPGKPWDPDAQLCHFGFRERGDGGNGFVGWLQEDPIPNLNRYALNYGDPVNFLDPDGRDAYFILTYVTTGLYHVAVGVDVVVDGVSVVLWLNFGPHESAEYNACTAVGGSRKGTYWYSLSDYNPVARRDGYSEWEGSLRTSGVYDTNPSLRTKDAEAGMYVFNSQAGHPVQIFHGEYSERLVGGYPYDTLREVVQIQTSKNFDAELEAVIREIIDNLSKRESRKESEPIPEWSLLDHNCGHEAVRVYNEAAKRYNDPGFDFPVIPEPDDVNGTDFIDMIKRRQHDIEFFSGGPIYPEDAQ